MGANLNAKKTEFSYGGEFLQPWYYCEKNLINWNLGMSPKNKLLINWVVVCLILTMFSSPSECFVILFMVCVSFCIKQILLLLAILGNKIMLNINNF